MTVKVEIDREKILDEAVFMAIQSLVKCKQDDVITSPDRLQRAIGGLQKTYDEIKDIIDEDQYPSSKILESKGYI